MATKDSLARGIQKRISKVQGPEEFQKANTEFARGMSESIGSALESLTVNNELKMSSEQQKVFKDMLSVLEKISTSTKDTEKERLEIRKFLAKAVAQAEIQIELLENEKKEKKTDKEEKEKKIEKLEKEITVLNESKEKIEKESAPKIEAAEIQLKRLEKEKEEAKGDEKKIKKIEEEEKFVKEEKDKLQKKIDELEKEIDLAKEEKKKTEDENEKLQNEITDLEKQQDQQQQVAGKARGMDPGAGKAISGKEMFKKGLVSDLSNMLPGLSFEQKEGEGFKGMLGRNAKSLLSPKGMFNAVWGQAAKSEPKFDTMVAGEKQAAAIREQKESLTGKKPSSTPSTTSTTDKPVTPSIEAPKSGVSPDEMKALEKQGLIPSDPEGRDRFLKKFEEAKQKSGGSPESKPEAKSETKPTEGVLEPKKEEDKKNDSVTDAIHKETEIVKNIFDLLKDMGDAQKKQDQDKDKEKNTVTAKEQQSLLGQQPAQSEKPGAIAAPAPVAASLAAPESHSAGESKKSEGEGGGGGGGGGGQEGGGMGVGDMISTAGDLLGGKKGKGLGKVLGKGTKGVGKLFSKFGGKGAGKLFSKLGGKGLGKIASKIGGKGLGKILLKSAGKSVLKKIPALGWIAGLGFGASRLMKGDWKGALGEVASGAVGSIPLIGTAASLAIDAGMAVRDAKMESSGEVASAGAPTGEALESATDQAAPPMMPPMPAAPTNNIVNNIGGAPGKGMSPNIPTAPIRSTDNSFIRFQDKRVARV